MGKALKSICAMVTKVEGLEASLRRHLEKDPPDLVEAGKVGDEIHTKVYGEYGIYYLITQEREEIRSKLRRNLKSYTAAMHARDHAEIDVQLLRLKESLTVSQP